MEPDSKDEAVVDRDPATSQETAEATAGPPLSSDPSEDPDEPTSREAFHILETRLGYFFQNPVELETALTHKSWANERGPNTPNNERLEFLGDALFSLVVGHLLMRRYPEMNEGVLSRARSALVSTAALAELATGLDLGTALLLGRGEARTGGRQKPSILADACEAVAAAIYLDGGFQAAMSVLGRLLEPRLEPAIQALGRQDPKTHLQERIQALTKRPPTYLLKDTIGPPHALEFIVVLRAANRDLAEGTGKNKKDAEQHAAAQVLGQLRQGASLSDLLGLGGTEQDPSPATLHRPLSGKEDQ